MRDSLESKASPFDGLHRQQISVLLDLLQESELAEKEYITRRYRERAPEFAERSQISEWILIVKRGRGSLYTSREYQRRETRAKDKEVPVHVYDYSES